MGWICAYTDGGRDKNDFLGDAGERYRSSISYANARIYYYHTVGYGVLHFYEFRPVVMKRVLIKGRHAKRRIIRGSAFPRERNTYRSLLMKGFLLRYIAEFTS